MTLPYHIGEALRRGSRRPSTLQLVYTLSQTRVCETVSVLKRVLSEYRGDLYSLGAPRERCRDFSMCK
jgi:hypothetical protein